MALRNLYLILLLGLGQAVNAATGLQPVESCPALLDELKQAAIVEMEERVDAALADALRWGLCGYPYVYADDVGAITSPAPAAEAGGDPNRAQEYSETNTQVAGVDEADFIKNDAKYIYILSGGRFHIVDAWPPTQASIVSDFEIEGTPKKLFVHNGYAWIYSSLDRIVQSAGGYNVYFDSECTYGYDCDFTGDGRRLKITVLDLEDVTDPQLVREVEFSGAYLNSRRIGDAVYSVVVFPEAHIDGLQYRPPELYDYEFCSTLTTPEQVSALFENLKAANRKLLEAADLGDWLPEIRDTRYVDGVPQETGGLVEDCSNFYRAPEKDGRNYLALVSGTMDGSGELDTGMVLGRPGAVYASSDALYIAARHNRHDLATPWFFPQERGVEDATTLYKFTLRQDPPAATYQANGVVKGRVLNQFAMDEYQGYFRIATTSGHLPSPDVHSTLSVLQAQDGELVVVGQIDDIAPTEDIRSVRFLGDRGYVVTFKKTDPLFVFDLSDPLEPVIAGELKIPGFSTYIHRLDDEHLLSIGYDADDHGNFAYFQGIMLQIFDVSNMNDPVLIQREIIGSRGSTSDAATNHLAFNYFAGKELLAIPMNICERSAEYPESGGSYGDVMSFSGLLVYHVSPDTGFEPVGGVPHSAPEHADTYYGRCYNWWTQSNSYVKRSIFMDDYVYSVTDDSLKASHLDDLSADVALVHFSEQPQCDPFHVDLCPTEPDCLATNAQWDTGTCRLPAYTARTTRSSQDLCEAEFDPATAVLSLPCVPIGGVQYTAELNLSSDAPVRLRLDEVAPAVVRMASRQGCEVIFNPAKGIVRMPCLSTVGQRFSADFKILPGVGFRMELMDFTQLP